MNNNCLVRSIRNSQRINMSNQICINNVFCNYKSHYLITFAVLLFVSHLALSAPIDSVKADMQFNEAELLDAPTNTGWSRKANIIMGAAARGDATPSWWVPHNSEYKSQSVWNAIIPWFHIYPGTAHAANNVRVKISGLKLYILKKSTNQWSKVNGDNLPIWAFHTNHISPSTVSQEVDVRMEPNGSPSYKFNSGLNPIHGGTNKYVINGYDVKAVFAQVTTQLILDDPTGPDDRADAQILVSIGADYYPTTAHSVADFTPMTHLPSVGASRYGLARNTHRTHYFATIDPPGPTNTQSEHQYRPHFVIPIAEFESNPPPVLINQSGGACN
ncbi:MAG: hypothetical protein H6938_03940 [Burkholderiales bacterium]|nr:hypothetical protein [Burkholderiales bacterium]